MIPATVDFDRAVAHGAALLLRLLIGIARADLAPMQAQLRQVLAESGMPLDAIDPDPLPRDQPGARPSRSDVELATQYARDEGAWLRKAFAEGPPPGMSRDAWIGELVADLRSVILARHAAQAPAAESPAEWAHRLATAVVRVAEENHTPAPPAEAEAPPTGEPQAEGVAT